MIPIVLHDNPEALTIAQGLRDEWPGTTAELVKLAKTMARVNGA
jgi:hypothetical protein